MPDAPVPPSAVVRCQAQPRAARPAYREDMLCASSASTAVAFHGVRVPVCRIHAAKWDRWGAEAEAQAALQWGWERPETLAGDAARGAPGLASTRA